MKPDICETFFKDFRFSLGASGPADRVEGGRGTKRCTSGLFVCLFYGLFDNNNKYTHTTLLKFCDHHHPDVNKPPHSKT